MRKATRAFAILSCTAIWTLAGAQEVACTTCSEQVAFERAQAKCVRDLIEKQLAIPLAIIVIATDGCNAAIKDGTRFESVRQRKSKSKHKGTALEEPFLLTKSDAECLVGRLKDLESSEEEVIIDLRSC